MRFRTTAASAAALVAVAALLGGCGNEGSKQELSNRTAASLRSTLDEVEQLVATRDCTGAAQQAAALRSKVDGLPQRVDSDLRQALSSSVSRLESLVAARCQPETQTTPEAPAGTTAQDGVQPGGDSNQTEKPAKDNKPKKDKQPKKEKPKQDAQPPQDTGGAGQEDPGLNDQGGGGVPPGQ